MPAEIMSLRELEKYTRHFLQKTVQIVVGSRLGGERIQTNCCPKGNDWFNIAITDISDVNEQTRKCMDALGSDSQTSTDENDGAKGGFTLAKDWRLCCEISLKTNEGESMVLEYWVVSNEPLSVPDSQSGSMSMPSQSLTISEIYKKMSLMLKSLITLTRATPAYKISCAGQSADSYVICYRVYQSDINLPTLLRDRPQEAKHYSPEMKLGAICSTHNVLSVSLVYRTDMTPSSSSHLDLENPQLLPLTNDHFPQEKKIARNQEVKWDSNKPLVAAFASSPSRSPALDFPALPDETAFSSLFITRSEDVPESLPSNVVPGPTISDPLPIPDQPIRLSSSPGGSSGDSFVFVEMKAPFANDENELGSFFNGPSPTFSGSGDLTEELSDITSQLAMIESNVQVWDSFVDSVCCPNEDDAAKPLT